MTEQEKISYLSVAVFISIVAIILLFTRVLSLLDEISRREKGAKPDHIRALMPLFAPPARIQVLDSFRDDLDQCHGDRSMERPIWTELSNYAEMLSRLGGDTQQ